MARLGGLPSHGFTIVIPSGAEPVVNVPTDLSTPPEPIAKPEIPFTPVLLPMFVAKRKAPSGLIAIPQGLVPVVNVPAIEVVLQPAAGEPAGGA